MSDDKEFYAVFRNTDLTEGRGQLYSYAITESPSAARRLSIGQDVQGSNATIHTVKPLVHDGRLYIDARMVPLIRPTTKDIQNDAELAATRAREARAEIAIGKARSLGLSDADIQALEDMKG